MHCLGGLSGIMVVPQHVGVEHPLHSLQDVGGGTGSFRAVSQQVARSKVRIQDLVPKEVVLVCKWERGGRLQALWSGC